MHRAGRGPFRGIPKWRGVVHQLGCKCKRGRQERVWESTRGARWERARNAHKR